MPNNCDLLLKKDIFMKSDSIEQITTELETLDYSQFQELTRDTDFKFAAIAGGIPFFAEMSQDEYSASLEFLKRVVNRNQSFRRNTNATYYFTNPLAYDAYVKCIEVNAQKDGVSAVIKKNEIDKIILQISFSSIINSINSVNIKLTITNGYYSNNKKDVIIKIRKNDSKIIEIFRGDSSDETIITLDPEGINQHPIILTSKLIIPETKIKSFLVLKNNENFHLNNNILSCAFIIENNSPILTKPNYKLYVRGQFYLYRNYGNLVCPSGEYSYAAGLRLSFNNEKIDYHQFTHNPPRWDKSEEANLHKIDIFKEIPNDIITQGSNSLRFDYIFQDVPCKDLISAPLAFKKFGYLLLEEGKTSTN